MKEQLLNLFESYASIWIDDESQENTKRKSEIILQVESLITNKVLEELLDEIPTGNISVYAKDVRSLIKDKIK